MEESPLVRLDLCLPLVYAELTDFHPDIGNFSLLAEKTAFGQAHEELLLCFELDSGQSRSIEPEREHLLGALIFAGRGNADDLGGEGKKVTLPAGKYLFAQRREALNREKWLDMAVEQQKDGLWERLKPENRLYVRYLFEDGRPITQLFRPIGLDLG